MEFVIGLLGLFFVLAVVLGAFIAVKAVRTVQRGVERTGAQVRRTVEETTLKARSAQPGPTGELARTRLELRSSIDSTRRALETGAASDPSLQEALGLLDRLHDHARQVDGELRLLMEREPDRARIAQQLPEAKERVAHIKQSADSLRFAAQDRARKHDAEGLAALREQIEIESGALREWRSSGLEELDRLDGQAVPSVVSGADKQLAPDPGAGPWQGAESGNSADADADRATEAPRRQPEPEPGPQSPPQSRGASRFDKGRPRSAS